MRKTVVFCLRDEGKKDEAVPLQALTDQQGSRKLRLPEFVTPAQDGDRLSVLLTDRLYPRKYSWYSFLLEAESTPGPKCDRKDFMSMKNSNDTSWDRTSDLPICSTAPKPLCYRGPLRDEEWSIFGV